MKQFIMILGLLLSVSLLAEEWHFPDDDLEARIAAVSDGELILLQTPPEQPAHHHWNLIQITEASLKNGWVLLEQCHHDLDPVAETEIVYHPERIRNIQLLNSENITTTRIEGATVQLSGIGSNAHICLQSESRALTSQADGGYRLKNGPFMRRFLDGYYPMRVTLEISYPHTLIELQDFTPQPAQAGTIQYTPGRIVWDSWFKGRLFTEFDFQLKQP